MSPQKSKRDLREVSVQRCEYISKNIRRVTFTGEDLSDFPSGYESGYVKLYLPCENDEPYVRTFTIRKQRSELNEIDIDFAIHQGDAPASNWAEHAQPGDTIHLSGPGATKLIDVDSDWFILVADMTGLPALSVNLETLPKDARGYAVFEVISEQDIHAIDAPSDVTISWVINPKPGTTHLALLEKVKNLVWLAGKPSIWAACEFSAMQSLRTYFKQDRAIPKDVLYVSSYWKLGVAEDEHKRIKRRDNQLNDA